MIGAGTIPTVIHEVTEARAKKLTVIMNETRGSADTADLAELLSSIGDELDEDLLNGLPYTDEYLADLLAMGTYNWDEIAEAYDENQEEEAPEPEESKFFQLHAELDDDTEAEWRQLVTDHNDGVFTADARIAGAIIAQLISTHRM